MPEQRAANSEAALLAEYGFLCEAIRQSQRERVGFLGFALAASGLILGLLMKAAPARTPAQACFLVALAAMVTIVAERLTIRASNGVASSATYVRLFLEPALPGLRYQQRHDAYKRQPERSVGAARGFGIAYVALTAAFAAAWVAAPTHGGRAWWQTLAVVALGVLSVAQAAVLLRARADRVVAAWERVRAAEQAGAAVTAAASEETPAREEAEHAPVTLRDGATPGPA
ncbi:MAG TPA: hypothetical protein VFS59_03035 [Gemmatimonadaceae bacterium]|nr:hypothetical protein [Gemmatimonadaceae bacterium]